MTLSKLLTIDEVAEWLQIPITTIYKHRHLKQGVGLLGIKVGRHLRWRQEDIEAWLKELSEQARAEAQARRDFEALRDDPAFAYREV